MYIKNAILSCFLMAAVSAAWAQLPTKSIPAQVQSAADGSVTAGGDSKFYVKLYGGYGLLTPGSYKLTSMTTNSFSIGGSGMGAGVHYGGGVGYIISDFLNIGLDADNLSGHDLTSKSISTSNPEFYASSARNVKYSILSLIPNVTFKALSKPTYFIYTRIGIVFTAHTKFIDTQLDSSDDKGQNFPYDQTITNTTTTYKSNLNVGIQVAPGIQFQISGKVRGFAELVGTYLPVSPSSSVQVIKQSIYDDSHHLSATNVAYPENPSTSTTALTYVNSGTAGSQQPKTVFNANSIGINAGIVYRF